MESSNLSPRKYALIMWKRKRKRLSFNCLQEVILLLFFLSLSIVQLFFIEKLSSNCASKNCQINLFSLYHTREHAQD